MEFSRIFFSFSKFCRYLKFFNSHILPIFAFCSFFESSNTFSLDSVVFSDSFVCWSAPSGFFHILSVWFFRIIFGFIRILLDPVRFYPIFPDSVRFSWILSNSSGFPHILSDSSKFSRILGYFLVFFRILLDPLRILPILSDFLIFFRNLFGSLRYSLVFFRIFRESNKIWKNTQRIRKNTGEPEKNQKNKKTRQSY